MPQAKAHGRGRQALWRAAQVALLTAVAWGVYRSLAPDLRGLSWSQIADLEPNVAVLLFSTVLLLIVYITHALLWRQIMVDLAMARPSVLQTIRVYFLASLGRYLPGKLWQLAGLAVLAGRAGWPASGAAAAAVLGQLGFLTTGLIFLALLLPRWPGGLGAVAAAVLIVLVVAALWTVLVTQRGSRLRAWVLDRVAENARAKLEGVFELAGRVRSGVAISWAVGYGVSWIVLGMAFTTFVSAFVPGALAWSRDLAGTIAASYLWGYVIVITPAGLGAREIAMSGLLQQIPAFPPAAALVIPVASRIWFTVAEILPLVVIPLAHRRATSETERRDGPNSTFGSSERGKS